MKRHVLKVPIVAATEGTAVDVRYFREKTIVVRPTGLSWDVALMISYDDGGTFTTHTANITAAAEVQLVDAKGFALLLTHVRLDTNAAGVPGDAVAEPCVASVNGYPAR